ncbi:MAG: DUF1801 domain-containing protein [Winogradskyella sp.]|nr:DUF1801 domain-containing protein [Winogradskyella sp.]
MNPNVTTYLDNLSKWQEELTLLRKIVLDCNLTEDYKWMHPCYTYKNKNVIIIHDFKDYCAISFLKGSLLKDTKGVLIQPTENMQAGRQIRFTHLDEIKNLATIIKQYIFEAIEVEKSGQKVSFKSLEDYKIPTELEEQFQQNPIFKNAFNNLSKGRQKGYLLHFGKPKQSKTKTARIEKNIQRIIDGYGLTDCTCGLSKRKPNCDGSHKQLNT